MNSSPPSQLVIKPKRDNRTRQSETKTHPCNVTAPLHTTSYSAKESRRQAWPHTAKNKQTPAVNKTTHSAPSQPPSGTRPGPPWSHHHHNPSMRWTKLRQISCTHYNRLRGHPQWLARQPACSWTLHRWTRRPIRGNAAGK
jgi:hypothetical protein